MKFNFEVTSHGSIYIMLANEKLIASLIFDRSGKYLASIKDSDLICHIAFDLIKARFDDWMAHTIDQRCDRSDFQLWYLWLLLNKDDFNEVC